MKRKQKGQTLLITLLVMAVAITVALSLIGRSATDVSMTGKIEESARAFAAAEAGIEETLQSNTANAGTIIASDTNTKFSTTIADIGSGTNVYAPTNVIRKGESETFWLVHHNEDGALMESDPEAYTGATIDVCWEHGGDTKSALEITVIYKNGTEYAITRGAYDPDTTRAGSEKSNFSDVTNNTSGCGMVSGVYMQTVTLPREGGSVPLMLRIRPYYADAKILINPLLPSALPSQGQEVSSTGTTGGGVTRKIVVKRKYESIPDFLDYSIYSQENFEKTN